MNVPLITMPAHDAEVAFQEYQSAVKARHTEEDAAIMEGYRAMMKGHSVIDIEDAIGQAGLDACGRPHLAICRADGHYCWFEHRHDGPIFSLTERQQHRHTRTYVRLRRGLFGENAKFLLPGRRYQWAIRALVPSIPPRLRPKGALSSYHILWEADWEWVPKDPLLLRHLYGHLYAVLAQWDLTELERAVLKGALAE